MQASEITVGMWVNYSKHPFIYLFQVISNPRPHNGKTCVLLRCVADYVPIDELTKKEANND